MPISVELRSLYPSNWPEISRRVRFDRARGRCEACGRPHGRIVYCLPDGRWLDPSAADSWRDARDEPINKPSMRDMLEGLHTVRVVLTTAHLEHDPTRNLDSDLAAWCSRCHILHDLEHHKANRTLHYRMKWALGDLLAGPYPVERCGRAG